MDIIPVTIWENFGVKCTFLFFDIVTCIIIGILIHLINLVELSSQRIEKVLFLFLSVESEIFIVEQLDWFGFF